MLQMIYTDALKLIKNLPAGKPATVYKNAATEVYILRPEKSFKDYDKEKNFQIWLKEGKREFKPNHLRIFIDLNLRVRSRPDLKNKLLLAFDNICYGANPETELKELAKENFEHSLNDLQVTGVLVQLLFIEQEYNYTIKESKYEPRTLFFQGWLREFIDNPKEIDNLCMSVCRGQPPMTKYTSKENGKHKKFVKNLNDLWYLENN